MERISVAIRVRPAGKEDPLVKGNHWIVDKNTISLCNCYGAPVPGFSYAFDQVFSTKSSNFDVYNVHAKEVIMSATEGFNGTVFAYGQTSSGKTYTMQGTDSQPGVIRQAVRDVFENISQASGREFLIRVSYLEIYNEDINDLLAPENRKLQVHENIERGVFVAALREEIVNSPEQVMEFLKFGEAHRHFGETNMNIYSSRSHTIFRMVIESRDKNRISDAVRVSTLNLVDLAGSERAAKTGAGGVRLREGSHINKSLMTLGTVINKLSEGPGKGGHVPYRDSKLTRILQSALSGNAKTAIICTINPHEIHIDETKGTLQFASRAKKVATCAHVNEVLTDAALLKRQRREIEELRQKLQGLKAEEYEKQLLSLRNDLLKHELEKEQLALELEEERKRQTERERRIKEQEKKIENLSCLVMSSPHKDNLPNSKRPRCTQSCTQQDFNRNSFEHADARSMISTRRGRRERALTPLPAFEALLSDDDASWSNSSRFDVFSRAADAAAPQPPLIDNVADEDTWVSMNKDDPDPCEEEWMKMNTEQAATQLPYTPCVKSSKAELLEFQLKELQVQYEELQSRHKTEEDQGIVTRNRLDALISKSNLLEEANRELEQRLMEATKQLDDSNSALEQREAEKREQLDSLVTRNVTLQQANQQLQQELMQTKKQLDDSNSELKNLLKEKTMCGEADQKETEMVDQASLMESLQMSEEHVRALDEQYASIKLERDRLSQILAAEMERNVEMELCIHEQKASVASELKRYVELLSYQHDNISALCSGIKDFEDGVTTQLNMSRHP